MKKAVLVFATIFFVAPPMIATANAGRVVSDEENTAKYDTKRACEHDRRAFKRTGHPTQGCYYDDTLYTCPGWNCSRSGWFFTYRPTAKGCPRGYACIWQGRWKRQRRPEHRYYRYGSYNFVNEFRRHVVWNNQTGRARVLLCRGYNGRNCTVRIPAEHLFIGNLTPFNSIRLIP